MNMMMMSHLCQGVANDDIQLTIVYKNLVIADDKKGDATNAKDATDDAVDWDDSLSCSLMDIDQIGLWWKFGQTWPMPAQTAAIFMWWQFSHNTASMQNIVLCFFALACCVAW